jgi:hypothetical protein
LLVSNYNPPRFSLPNSKDYSDEPPIPHTPPLLPYIVRHFLPWEVSHCSEPDPPILNLKISAEVRMEKPGSSPNNPPSLSATTGFPLREFTL